YDAALRQRGSLTVWFTEEAIAAWRAEPRTTRGGQPHYSALAITTALTLRAVFRLALRQTEGLIGSVIRLLGLDLAIPDHSTLSRRAETLAVAGPPSSAEPVHLLVDSTGLKLSGAGEWLVEKHGTSRRRSWRKPEQLRTKSPDPFRLRKETERRKRRCAGAVLVWNDRETEMAYLAEVKALLLALVGRSPRTEGVFLNQNLAVRATGVLRNLNANFLGTLARCLFDLVHELRDRLRPRKFHEDM